MYETLEQRRLLASSLAGRVLTVAGTGDFDSLSLSISDAQVVVRLNGGYRRFAGVTSVIVNTFGGNDLVSVSKSITRPTSLYGGAGNDTLTGGGGIDLIDGGEGDDLAFGNGG